MKVFNELWAYRHMIYSLVKKDLRGRYKGSVLGFLWTFINPLLQLVVYTIVFSVIMRNGIDKFYLYLFVVLVPWIFFSTSITSGCSSVLMSKDMVKKIYFPREVLPIACVTSNFVNMLFSFLVIFGVLIMTGWGINFKALLCLPVIMIVEYILAMGIAMLTSAVTVYCRDLEYVLGIITMAWMYMTPVLYGPEMVPEKLRFIWNLNPMTPVAMAYRDVLYYKVVPELSTLIHAFVMGIVVVVIGFVVFRKLQKGFAENF